MFSGVGGTRMGVNPDMWVSLSLDNYRKSISKWRQSQVCRGKYLSNFEFASFNTIDYSNIFKEGICISTSRHYHYPSILQLSYLLSSLWCYSEVTHHPLSPSDILKVSNQTTEWPCGLTLSLLLLVVSVVITVIVVLVIVEQLQCCLYLIFHQIKVKKKANDHTKSSWNSPITTVEHTVLY